MILRTCDEKNPIYLSGWARERAPLTYSNADVARLFGVDSAVVANVEAKIGTQSRFCGTDLKARRQVVAAATLGAAAADGALRRAKCRVDDVDVILGCTTILDHMCPSLAVRALKALGGTRPTLTIDLYGGCGSTATALFLAGELLRSGTAESVLIVTAEVLTRQLWLVRNPFELFLFGDGAAALLLSRRKQGPLVLRHYTAATIPDLGGVRDEIMTVPVSSGGALPALFMVDERVDPSMPNVDVPPAYRAHHHARLAAQWGAEYLSKSIAAVTPSIDADVFVVPHQPSRVVVDAVRAKLGLAASQVAFINPTHGNLSSASVPMAFCETFNDDLAAFYPRTVLAPVGTGLMCGAALFERTVE